MLEEHYKAWTSLGVVADKTLHNTAVEGLRGLGQSLVHLHEGGAARYLRQDVSLRRADMSMIMEFKQRLLASLQFLADVSLFTAIPAADPTLKRECILCVAMYCQLTQLHMTVFTFKESRKCICTAYDGVLKCLRVFRSACQRPGKSYNLRCAYSRDDALKRPIVQLTNGLLDHVVNKFNTCTTDGNDEDSQVYSQAEQKEMCAWLSYACNWLQRSMFFMEEKDIDGQLVQKFMSLNSLL